MMEGFNDRICTLYNSASSLLNLGQTLDASKFGFFSYCPFFCYQTFVCAAFTILRILSNGFFRTVIDVEAGNALIETAIRTLRVISIANNDLPARLGDVIAFFCSLSDPTALGGVEAKEVRLSQVRNRLSMSVVYDCLWTWRQYFKPQGMRT
jgi:transcriptional regulatory protein LEU3